MHYLVKSIGAGICIGIGGFVYLSVSDKVIGSFLFSIGLFSVLIFKLDLYTGIVCKPSVYKNEPLLIFESFIGNMLGAVLISILANNDLVIEATALSNFKLNKYVVDWMFMSILCGMFIALAVYGWNSKNDIHSHIMVVLGVMGFILSGSEHVVADAFYFSVGKVIDSEIILRILSCGIGNMIGGIIIGGILTAVEYFDSKKDDFHFL